MQWGFFCSRAPGWGLGVQHLVTGAVCLLSNPSDNPCIWGTEQPETQYLIWHDVCSLLAFLECFRCGQRRGSRSVFVERCLPFCPLPFDFVLLFTHWLWRVASAWLKVQACGRGAAGWEERAHPHVPWGVPSAAAQVAVSWLSGGYKWPGKAVVCGPHVLQKSPSGLIWQDHRCCVLGHRLRHCWWYRSQPAIQGGKIHLRKLVLRNGSEVFWLGCQGYSYKEGSERLAVCIVRWPRVLAVVCKRWQH